MKQQQGRPKGKATNFSSSKLELSEAQSKILQIELRDMFDKLKTYMTLPIECFVKPEDSPYTIVEKKAKQKIFYKGLEEVRVSYHYACSELVRKFKKPVVTEVGDEPEDYDLHMELDRGLQFNHN